MITNTSSAPGTRPTTKPTVVVWDIGNVLIRWNPRNLYRKLFPSSPVGEAEMEEFLATVVPMATFNARLDLGERCLDLCAEAASHHRNVDPNLIYAYANRWQEMVSGPIEESMDLVLELKRRGIQQIALSNFGHEFLPTAERFPVLQAFDQRVISFEVGLVKPNPAIFQLLLDRCGLAASDCLFVDDNAENIATASTLGFHTHQFREPADPTALRALLVRYRLLQ